MLIIKPAVKIKKSILEKRKLTEDIPLNPKIPAITARIKKIIASLSNIIRFK
jgi:hypothetical protein